MRINQLDKCGKCKLLDLHYILQSWKSRLEIDQKIV